MTTICVACNIKSFGMINILCHPNGLDKMFTFVSNLPEVQQNNSLKFKIFFEIHFFLD